MKKGRYQQAYRSLRRLRHYDLFAARDLYFIDSQLRIEASAIGGSNYLTRAGQLFTIPRVRRATLASFTGKSSTVLLRYLLTPCSHDCSADVYVSRLHMRCVADRFKVVSISLPSIQAPSSETLELARRRLSLPHLDLV